MYPETLYAVAGAPQVPCAAVTNPVHGPDEVTMVKVDVQVLVQPFASLTMTV